MAGPTEDLAIASAATLHPHNSRVVPAIAAVRLTHAVGGCEGGWSCPDLGRLLGLREGLKGHSGRWKIHQGLCQGRQTGSQGHLVLLKMHQRLGLRGKRRLGRCQKLGPDRVPGVLPIPDLGAWDASAADWRRHACQMAD